MFLRMRVHRARVRPALGLALFVAGAAAVVAVAGTSVALELAPAALLALALLFGRYPGERAIRRVAGGNRVAPAPASRPVVLPRAPRSLGARLAALAVPGAGRAPPAAALI
jgi:hypothetical protein